MSTGTVSGRSMLGNGRSVMGRMAVGDTNNPCPACNTCKAVCPLGVTVMLPNQVKKLQPLSSHDRSMPVPRMPMVAVGVLKVTLRVWALPISPVSARTVPFSNETRNRPSAGFLLSKMKSSTLKRVPPPSDTLLSSRNASTALAWAAVSTRSPG